jgi:N-methylhydantoinase A
MRYAGQGSGTRVRIPSGVGASDRALLSAFDDEYRRLYGRTGPKVDVEVMGWRVVSRGPAPEGVPAAAGGAGRVTAPRPRTVYFGRHVEAAVHDGEALSPGEHLDGPAIVEQHEATIVIPPGARGAVRDDRSVEIALDARAES